MKLALVDGASMYEKKLLSSFIMFVLYKIESAFVNFSCKHYIALYKVPVVARVHSPMDFMS